MRKPSPAILVTSVLVALGGSVAFAQNAAPGRATMPTGTSVTPTNPNPVNPVVSVSLDRVIKSAEKDRKKIGRNGQLLNSIAPRTNVDRSNEMPDDGPTPALSGLSNSLRR